MYFDVFDVFKYLMYWCAQPEAENQNENLAERIGYLYKSGQDVMIVTFCTYQERDEDGEICKETGWSR